MKKACRCSKLMKTFRQSEENYRSLVEGLPGMVWLARADGFVEYLNPCALNYLGLPAEEICGWGWRKLVHVGDAPQAEAARDQAVRNGTPYGAEYRMRRKDGTYRWQMSRGLPLRGPNGQALKWVGIWADTHDDKRVGDLGNVPVEAGGVKQNRMHLQLAIQASEEDRAKLAAIVESSDDAIIGKTLGGIITSWNQGAQRLFGYRADEMVGHPVSRLIPADRPDEEAEILARLRRGEHVMHFETVRQRKDGRLVDVSVSSSPIRDGGGQIVGASKIVRDVSGRKHAEALVEQANERLREQAAVLELSPVLVRDLDSRIVLWTCGAEGLYGYSKEEALGRVSHELFCTEFPQPLK
jgi:PAS domain S-box-containing protein